MEIGETWAYRAKVRGPVTPARVDRVGDKRPPRVRVTFLADEYEGASEWVPPSRLKVPWAEVEGFLARESAIDALAAQSSVPEAVDSGARFILEGILDPEVAFLEYSYLIRGVFSVRQPEELARICGVAVEDVLDPTGFWDGDAFLVAWPVAEKLIRSLAVLRRDELVARVHREEAKARREESNGTVWREAKGKEHYIAPAQVAESNEEYTWPMLRAARDLIDMDKAAEDQIKFLRDNAERAVFVAEMAIESLRDAGGADRAWRLHQMLFPEASKRSWLSVHEIKKRSGKEREEAAREASSKWGWARIQEYDERAAELKREVWGQT